jgi:peptide/nickel transport system permease protein
VFGYAARRLILAVPLALGVATLVFVLLETAPGDPADLMLAGRPVPPEIREQILEAYGLDRSAGRRYASWIGALALHGDLGWSISRSRPVAELIGEALPRTALLAATALVLHVIAGVALGMVSASTRRRWVDRSIGGVSLVLYAMPAFWLGLMAVLCLSYLVPLFPASSMHSVGAEAWSWPRRWLDVAWHLVLPASVLGLASTAAMLRFVRAGLLRALARGFARAARARGVGSRRVLLVHALRNALLPVINLIGVSLPALLSGSLVIEVVFAWPGMGRLTYDAILMQDFPVVLATTLLATLLVVVGTLAADLAMVAADPRIRLRTSGVRA